MPKPTVQAFHLADYVLRDESTKKVSLIGLFDALWADTFPANHTGAHLFLRLGELKGRQLLKFAFRDLGTQDTLLESPEVGLPPADPLGYADLIMALPPIPMPREGEFAFEAYVNDEWLSDLKIKVTQRSRPGGGRPTSQG
jgi:hypothetical protein